MRERSDVGENSLAFNGNVLLPRRTLLLQRKCLCECLGEFKDTPIVGPLSGCQAYRYDRTIGGADGGFGRKNVALGDT